MKKSLAILCLPVIFLSCVSVKTYPLKGSYPGMPIVTISDNDKEAVWDKLIDFFAQRGLSIKIIDKSSGLIISELSKLTWTHEDKKGNLKKPGAWIVIPMEHLAGTPILPVGIIGEWNVRLKAYDGNKTSINVNIVNIKKEISGGKITDYVATSGKSTGIFEKIIADAIK